MGYRNSPVGLRINDRRKKKHQRKEFPHLKVIEEELEGQRARGTTPHLLRS